MSSKPGKLRVPANLQPWFDARKEFKLSHATVQMARELGLNPKKFGKLADTRGASWKRPLPDFIAECYFKAHRRHSPEVVRSLEQVIKDSADKKEQRRERKAERLLSGAVVVQQESDSTPQQSSAHGS